MKRRPARVRGGPVGSAAPVVHALVALAGVVLAAPLAATPRVVKIGVLTAA